MPACVRCKNFISRENDVFVFRHRLKLTKEHERDRELSESTPKED